jgi:hypothetical protein
MTKKLKAKDRSLASYIQKEAGGIAPTNLAALLGGPPGIALDMALTAARGMQEKRLAIKEEKEYNIRKKVIEQSRVRKIAKSNAKRTKKHKNVATKAKKADPKSKQYGTTKGSK